MKAVLRISGYACLAAALTLAYALFGVHHPMLDSNAPDTGLPVAKAASHTAKVKSAWLPIWTVDTTENGRPSWRQWTWLVGKAGDIREEAWYTADAANSFVNDSSRILSIRAIRDSNGRWTSARLMSRMAFQPPKGGSLKISMDVLFPTGFGPGYFPAVWILGSNWHRVNWPKSGEFDVAESVPSKRVVIGDMHCWYCNEPTGILRHVSLTPGWHHFKFVWDTNPKRVTWSEDYAAGGQRTFTLTPAELGGSKGWQETFGHSYNLIVNLAIGGYWPGPSSSSTRSGGTLSIKNLTVYTNTKGNAQ
jgi:beta-glucanase (GH16 family)